MYSFFTLVVGVALTPMGCWLAAIVGPHLPWLITLAQLDTSSSDSSKRHCRNHWDPDKSTWGKAGREEPKSSFVSQDWSLSTWLNIFGLGKVGVRYMEE